MPRILAIGAHLDDVELGCGGVLALAARRQYPVAVVVVTRSSYVGLSTVRGREDAVREGRAALQVLGLAEPIELDYPTMDIPDTSDVVMRIERVINEFEPTVIFTHDVFSTHQDHRRTGWSSLSAGRKVPSILAFESMTPSASLPRPFRPQLYVDVSVTIEQKLEAIRRHDTQVRRYGNEWIRAISARATLRGWEARVDYAEAFEVLRLTCSLEGLE